MKIDLDSYSTDSNQVITGEFINRELSWLSFNSRVLYYANKNRIPLNERLKFLSITESNLDEFISVRFSDIYKHRDVEPYKELLSRIKEFKKSQEIVYNNLVKIIEKEKGMKFTKISELNKKEKDKLYEYYYNNIFPLLTPSITDENHFCPPIISGQLCIAYTIKRDNIESVCIIPIPKSINYIIQINKNKIVFIEDVIKEFASKSLFINENIVDKVSFKIIKDASIILSHNKNKFIIDRMKDVLDKRVNSNSVFLDIEKSASDSICENLKYIFNISSKHVYYSNSVIDFKRFIEPILSESDSYEKIDPFVRKNYEDLFPLLKDRDILLHHPYDSYDTIIDFIKTASTDKKVVAIKQTLYRVSSIDSPIVNALCDAAINGKSVSVLIEIKARFDEYNNIQLIEKLKRAGAIVLLGTEYLKTHCKMCVVIRKEDNELKVYSHIGTGNYNEKTAMQYTDLSLLTSKKKLGIDLLNIFNILSGHSKPDDKLEKISYSPVNLRRTLEKNIDREIKQAKNNHRAEIFIKVNSISDSIIDKLYEAANAGVKIYIICRGICSIKPTKNITIKSIVGRFLEHSRIYYFYNNKNPEYFISSADLLTRNLDKRVEVLISLKDTSIINQVKWIIDVFKKDEMNSFIMNKNGKWHHLKGEFDSQDWFLKYSDTKKRKKKCK